MIKCSQWHDMGKRFARTFLVLDCKIQNVKNKPRHVHVRSRNGIDFFEAFFKIFCIVVMCLMKNYISMRSEIERIRIINCRCDVFVELNENFSNLPVTIH